MSIPAKFMKVTISPIVAWPRRCKVVPSRKMATSVSVAEARVTTDVTAHHVSTGICALSRSVVILRMARVSASTRVKLWITATLPSASEARSAKSLL